jgi:hypothetical protein
MLCTPHCSIGTQHSGGSNDSLNQRLDGGAAIPQLAALADAQPRSRLSLARGLGTSTNTPDERIAQLTGATGSCTADRTSKQQAHD